MFFPLQLIGSLVYTFRVRFVNMPRGISGTAYEPYMTRLLLHHTASRNDEGSRADRAAPARVVAPGPAPDGGHPGAGGEVERLQGVVPRVPGPAAVDADDLHQPSHALLRLCRRRGCRRGQSDPAARRARRGLGHALLRTVGGRSGPAPVGRAGQRRRESRCFEVDEPPTQAAKVEALRAAGVDHGHVVFAPTDFNQRSWLESLTEHGVRPGLAGLRPLGRRDDVSR